MKLCCFTTNAPCGGGEEFVLREIRQLASLGNEPVVYPVRPQSEYTGDEYRVFGGSAFSAKTLVGAFGFFCRHPVRTARAVVPLLVHSGSPANTLRNLAVAPRAVVCAAQILREGDFDFIYANWLATTSSAALIAAEICSLPLGITAHRFDVYAGNAVAYKASKAAFIRVIDEKGTKHVRSLAGSADVDKVRCIHLGVDIPKTLPEKKKKDGGRFVIATPAHLIEIKGHKYIIEAAALLREEYGEEIEFRFYGSGDDEAKLRELACVAGVENIISFCGYIKNSALLDMYTRGEIDAVLLASVWLGGSEHEGIPVCLMEAMSFGIPVISTETGGIPELLRDGAGLLIKDKSAQAIRDALIRLMTDEPLRQRLSEAGLSRVRSGFDNTVCTEEINRMMREAVREGNRHD